MDRTVKRLLVAILLAIAGEARANHWLERADVYLATGSLGGDDE